MLKTFLNFTLSAALILGMTACGGGSNNSTTTPETNEETAQQEEVKKVEEAETTEELVPTQEIVVEATGNTMADMAYNPSEIVMPAYTVVKLVFKNTATEGGMIHNFVLINAADADAIRQAGTTAGPDAKFSPTDDRILAKTKMLEPGESDEVVFETPGVGEYLVICTYPGHNNMTAKVIVE